MNTALFISILNMSFYTSIVILCVLVIRLFLKKSPKIFSYVLWSVVLFRLLCPFTFESAIGMFSNSTTTAPSVIETNIQQEGLGISYLTNDNVPTIEITTTSNYSPVLIISLVWLIGIGIMLLYNIVQLINIKKKLVGATPLKDNIYITDHIKSPFVIGILFPKIYLPSDISDSEQDYIIVHEKHHIKRLDHITRILGFIALTLHWFNPLVWVAFILSGKDMEMSCDEAVMKKMESDIRIKYSQSLLRFASDKKLFNATPLAFGESDTKERVKNVIKYKKPTIWISSIAILLVVFAVVILGTSQREVKTVQEGVYFMVVDDEQNTVFNSRIELEDGRFTFTYDVLSSYGNFGKYEIKDDNLILETDDRLYKYIFKIEDNNLIFQSNGSSSVQLTDENFGEEILDGSVFYLKDSALVDSDESIDINETKDNNISELEPLTLDEAVILALKTQSYYNFSPVECLQKVI